MNSGSKAYLLGEKRLLLFYVILIIHLTNFSTFSLAQKNNPFDQKLEIQRDFFSADDGKQTVDKAAANANLSIQIYTADTNTPVQNYQAKLKDVNTGTYIDSAWAGNSNSVTFFNLSTPVDNNKIIPLEFRLEQNYPNPFNPSTTIEFSLNNPQKAYLAIFNVKGQKIKTLSNEYLPSGKYQVTWAGDNDNGHTVASGVYFYRLVTNGQQITKKMINLGGGGTSSDVKPNGYSNGTQSMAKALGHSYVIELLSHPDSTRPLFQNKEIQLNLEQDTLVTENVDRYLRVPVLNQVGHFTINEDEVPADSLVGIVNAIGYDSSGNAGPVQMYLVQGNPNLINLKFEGNKIKVDSLAKDGNGGSHVVYGIIAPNGLSAEKEFDVIVNPMTDRNGQLKDVYGNARKGFVYATNDIGQKFIMQTRDDGTFAYQLNPSAWDSLKAHVKNDVRPEDGAFIKSHYFDTQNDLNEIIVVAVPHLDGNDYIGLDTTDSFFKEANFDHPVGGNVGKLKKADLNNMLDYVSSISWKGYTIIPSEQDYIIYTIRQKIDPYFTHPSAKWKVPQDSIMNYARENAINWFKDSQGALGSKAVWDDNGDGILEGAAIDLLYIINISGQDTIYNDKAIVQENLASKVAPGEVGITSPIRPSKTVLHKNTPKTELQPADILLIKICEAYPALTPHDDILTIGNYQTMLEATISYN